MSVTPNNKRRLKDKEKRQRKKKLTYQKEKNVMRGNMLDGKMSEWEIVIKDHNNVRKVAVMKDDGKLIRQIR